MKAEFEEVKKEIFEPTNKEVLCIMGGIAIGIALVVIFDLVFPSALASIIKISLFAFFAIITPIGWFGESKK